MVSNCIQSDFLGFFIQMKPLLLREAFASSGCLHYLIDRLSEDVALMQRHFETMLSVESDEK